MSKKIISICLAALMVFSTLCISYGANTKPDALPDAKGYPIKADNVTISWYVGEGFTLNEAYAKPEDSPFHKGLQEELGVKIDWTFPPVGADQLQNFNLVVASGNYPDVIFYSAIMKDAERFMDEGVIRDLSDHIEEYSPAYYSWLQSNPAYDRAMKTDSGKYYGYGFFREDGGWNDSYLGPVIRKDWLDEQKLDIPETVDDWDKVLKTFKEEYNSQLTFSWANRFKVGGGIAGAFGAYGGVQLRIYLDDNGKAQLAQAQPEWKEYMAKLNEWWEAGYIDQDVVSVDDTTARSKALNGETGIAITSMGQLSNWGMDAENAKNGANWIGLQYPTGSDGTLSYVFGGYGIGSVVAAVSTSCKDSKLETVMKALDYAYTKEGNLYWNYGKQGVSWDYDKDGKPAYTKLVTEDPNGINDAISKYGGSTWSGSCIQETLLLYLKNTPAAIAANDIWFYPNEEVTAKSNLPNGVTFTAEESNRKDELESAIKTYVEEIAVKFMNGEESINNFDKYIANVEKMGVAELMEIYQAAYERYLKR